jgi:hypothetical protein
LNTFATTKLPHFFAPTEGGIHTYKASIFSENRVLSIYPLLAIARLLEINC